MLQDLRDIIIVIYGILGIITLVIALIFIVVVGLAVRGLVSTANSAVQNAMPILEDIRETAARVRGTVNFVSETTVTPGIRAYGIFMGIRRGLSVLLGLRRRISR